MKVWSFVFLVLRHSFCRGITGVRSAPDSNAAFFSGNDRKGPSDLQSSLRAELPLAVPSHLWQLSGSWQLQLTAYGLLSYFPAAQPLPNTSISLLSEWTYIASGTSFTLIFDSIWDKFFWLACHIANCSCRLLRCAAHGAQEHNCKMWCCGERSLPWDLLEGEAVTHCSIWTFFRSKGAKVFLGARV